MNILAIDTTSTGLSIALVKGDKTYSFTKQIGKSGHSATLMPEIDNMLKSHDVNVNDLDVVAVNVGPGSFTGIRIGVSAMTAIAFATGAKRVAVTTFELIAHQRGNILAAVDAGHGNTYLAKCENGKVLSASFCEAGENIDLKDAEYQPLKSVDETLAEVVSQKAKNGEFVNVFEPFYMRKSQAEREKDEV